MIKIAPSLLSADFAYLKRDIDRISTADYVHVDVMDGIFVPNISIGVPVVRSIRKITAMPLDVHLMIDRPVRYIKAFADAGADILTVHTEADTPEQITAALEAIRAAGVRPALSIKPRTSAEALLPWIRGISMVLVMTVEPGFGGQAFMADQLPKIRAVREMIDRYNPGCELEVDGGIGPDTAGLVIEAGANVLVAGSSVYGAADIPARIAELRKG
ncbi:ribulose-phosphate 3-epimerase [Papillibacter cinnamivorans]|uniref:Ribulose-phosphate 3-epimerase n=1 Tax=Papillibacter cinnamivorans DSM 12816 TaxID=1122930 RepID=A0A1W2AWG7_9FIRM|nr:ribulose-phosphate 3-epimerase [Papillibacter cinnamivorans]SMC64954.1 ribulose-phosphate 3-epimerase [Papillibacter cinnamivorans DSM 12816]